MEPRRDDLDLGAELQALRPTPGPEFAASLDAQAASGFPRESGWTAAVSRLTKRIRSIPPRWLLAPAGALAIAAIVVATAVVAFSEQGVFQGTRLSLAAPEGEGATAERGLPSLHGTAAPSGTPSSAKGAGSVQYAESPPLRPFASHAGSRDIERSAQVVLGANPDQVRADAAKVFDAVNAANGIVIRSSIRDGGAGEAGAFFELLIPTDRLSDALAAFSAIAEVRSRHESTQDITAPTVGVGERLRDAQAKVKGLLAQLASAEAEAERAAVEAELRSERQRAAALRSRLSSLRRRANLSRVSLRIETGAGSSSSQSAGGWGVDDALGDSRHILAVAAGVTIIGLAVLGPLALIALLAWLAHRHWTRKTRERALG